MTEKFIIEYLSDFKGRVKDNALSIKIRDGLKKIKDEKNNNDDEEGAKIIWCLEQAIKIQEIYLEAYEKLVHEKYYKAWCDFEQCELALESLKPHFPFDDNKYYLHFIDKHTTQYQSLYPYKLFFSPEILGHEKECTICGKIIKIRNHCGHDVGEIYKGEMCCRRVTKSEILGISLVESPVQKFSVPFMQNEKTGKSVDHYDYSLLNYLVGKLLQSPFDTWDINWTKKMHPHKRFTGIGRNNKCPCGSEIKYKKCCLMKPGVLMSHCEFILEKPPQNPVDIEYTL